MAQFALRCLLTMTAHTMYVAIKPVTAKICILICVCRAAPCRLLASSVGSPRLARLRCSCANIHATGFSATPCKMLYQMLVPHAVASRRRSRTFAVSGASLSVL